MWAVASTLDSAVPERFHPHGQSYWIVLVWNQVLSLSGRPTCLSLSFVFSWNYEFLVHTPKLFKLWTKTWNPNVQSWFTCSSKGQVNSAYWFMVVDGIHGGNYKTDLEYTGRLGDLEAIVRLRMVPHICFYGAHLNHICRAPFIHPLDFTEGNGTEVW